MKLVLSQKEIVDAIVEHLGMYHEVRVAAANITLVPNYAGSYEDQEVSDITAVVELPERQAAK